jgi:hypothetical protein
MQQPRPGVRRPTMETASEVSIVSPGVRSLSATMPIASSGAQQLASMLGIMQGIGQAFTNLTEIDKNRDRTRLLRQGQASDQGQTDALALAQAFDFNLIDDEKAPGLIAAISGDPEEAPRRLSEWIMGHSEAVSLSTPGRFVDDEERKAYAAGYASQIQRYAMPWAKGLVDEMRGQYSAGMAAALRSNTNLKATRAEWSSNAMNRASTDLQFVEAVVVPAVDVLLDDGNHLAAIEIIGQVPATSFVPKLGELHGRAMKAFAEQRLGIFRRHAGSVVLSTNADSEAARTQAIGAIGDIVRHADSESEIVAAVRATVEEMGVTSPTEAVTLINNLLSDERAGLFPGSRIRNALVEARDQMRTSAGGDTEQDRRNLAIGMLYQYHATGGVLLQDGRFARPRSEKELSDLLVGQFGPDNGLRYYFELSASAKDKVHSAATLRASDTESDNTRVSIVAAMSTALTPADLSEEYRDALALFSAGMIRPDHFREIVGAYQDSQNRLPFRWETNAAAVRVSRLMEGRYQSVRGGIVETALGSVRDTRAAEEFESLRLEAMENWEQFIAGVISRLGEESPNGFRLGPEEIERISRHWEREEGTKFILRSAEIAVASDRRSNRQ